MRPLVQPEQEQNKCSRWLHHYVYSPGNTLAAEGSAEAGRAALVLMPMLIISEVLLILIMLIVPATMSAFQMRVSVEAIVPASTMVLLLVSIIGVRMYARRPQVAHGCAARTRMCCWKARDVTMPLVVIYSLTGTLIMNVIYFEFTTLNVNKLWALLLVFPLMVVSTWMLARWWHVGLGAAVATISIVYALVRAHDQYQGVAFALVVLGFVFFIVVSHWFVNADRQRETDKMKQFESYFYESPDSMALVDSRLRIVAANKSFVTLTRRPPGALVNAALIDLFHGDDDVRVSDFVDRMRAATGPSERVPLNRIAPLDADPAAAPALERTPSVERSAKSTPVAFDAALPTMPPPGSPAHHVPALRDVPSTSPTVHPTPPSHGTVLAGGSTQRPTGVPEPETPSLGEPPHDASQELRSVPPDAMQNGQTPRPSEPPAPRLHRARAHSHITARARLVVPRFDGAVDVDDMDVLNCRVIARRSAPQKRLTGFVQLVVEGQSTGQRGHAPPQAQRPQTPLTQRGVIGSGSGENLAAELALQRAVAAEEEERQRKSRLLWRTKLTHDLRSPLLSIVSHADLVVNSLNLEGDARASMDYISAQANLVSDMVRDILVQSELEAGVLKLVNSEFDLRENMFATLGGIESIVKSLSPGTELVYYCSNDIPGRLYGDNKQFRRILINFLSNAVKFTKTGYIAMSAEGRCTERDGRKAWEITVSVADSGKGISQENQSQLFRMWSQPTSPRSRSHEGHGIGLVNCYDIAKLMGGGVNVQSIGPGHGSTFSCTVVLDEEGGVAASPRPMSTPALGAAGAGDSPTDRRMKRNLTDPEPPPQMNFYHRIPTPVHVYVAIRPTGGKAKLRDAVWRSLTAWNFTVKLFDDVADADLALRTTEDNPQILIAYWLDGATNDWLTRYRDHPNRIAVVLLRNLYTELPHDEFLYNKDLLLATRLIPARIARTAQGTQVTTPRQHESPMATSIVSASLPPLARGPGRPPLLPTGEAAAKAGGSPMLKLPQKQSPGSPSRAAGSPTAGPGGLVLPRQFPSGVQKGPSLSTPPDLSGRDGVLEPNEEINVVKVRRERRPSNPETLNALKRQQEERQRRQRTVVVAPPYQLERLFFALCEVLTVEPCGTAPYIREDRGMKPPPMRPVEAPKEPRDPSSVVIYYADDEPMCLKLTSKLFAQLGYTVTQFPTGKELLQQAELKAADMYLVDYELENRTTGADVVARLRGIEQRQRRPRAPVVNFTGNEPDSVADRCMRAGFDYVVSKTITVDTIKGLIERFITRWEEPAPRLCVVHERMADCGMLAKFCHMIGFATDLALTHDDLSGSVANKYSAILLDEGLPEAPEFVMMLREREMSESLRRGVREIPIFVITSAATGLGSQWEDSAVTEFIRRPITIGGLETAFTRHMAMPTRKPYQPSAAEVSSMVGLEPGADTKLPPDEMQRLLRPLIQKNGDADDGVSQLEGMLEPERSAAAGLLIRSPTRVASERQQMSNREITIQRSISSILQQSEVSHETTSMDVAYP